MANPILDRVIQILDRLKTLTVETVVVDQAGNKVIKSEMDLIDGDITTTIDTAFITGELASTREFHNQQVINARQVVASNIRSLVDLAERIGDRIERYASESPPPRPPA
ncbi:MAG: hypothetical protein ACFCUO_05920 [Rhodospirillales bacterium]